MSGADRNAQNLSGERETKDYTVPIASAARPFAMLSYSATNSKRIAVSARRSPRTGSYNFLKLAQLNAHNCGIVFVELQATIGFVAIP